MTTQRPALLCFDGSRDAAGAIAAAATLLAGHEAVVATVWEPMAAWQPFDPGALVSGGVTLLGASGLGLDAIAEQVASEQMEAGVALAREAGLEATGRVAHGKAWRAICDLGEEFDASVIVLGARGLSRVQSALLGSVSSAVAVHAGRPVLIVPAARS